MFTFNKTSGAQHGKLVGNGASRRNSEELGGTRRNSEELEGTRRNSEKLRFYLQYVNIRIS